MEIEVDRDNTIKCMYQCDLCRRISVNRVICSICNRDICSSCTFFGWMGDLTDIYCKSCFNIGKEYFKRMEEEQEKFDTLMEKIEHEWKERAIEAANLSKNKTEC